MKCSHKTFPVNIDVNLLHTQNSYFYQRVAKVTAHVIKKQSTDAHTGVVNAMCTYNKGKAMGV